MSEHLVSLEECRRYQDTSSIQMRWRICCWRKENSLLHSARKEGYLRDGLGWRKKKQGDEKKEEKGSKKWTDVNNLRDDLKL